MKDKLTRGEFIRRGIKTRFSENRDKLIESQRTTLAELIDKEQDRVFGLAEKAKVGEPEPEFDIILDFVPLEEIKVELEKEGYPRKTFGSNLYADEFEVATSKKCCALHKIVYQTTPEQNAVDLESLLNK